MGGPILVTYSDTVITRQLLPAYLLRHYATQLSPKMVRMEMEMGVGNGVVPHFRIRIIRTRHSQHFVANSDPVEEDKKF